MSLTLPDELLNVLYRYANLILIAQLLVISELYPSMRLIWPNRNDSSLYRHCTRIEAVSRKPNSTKAYSQLTIVTYQPLGAS
jgi:hypothetical protein